MRNIEFRAWNKKRGIMVYKNEDKNTYWDGAYGYGYVGMLNSMLSEEYNTIYEFMQYTGLKDKNGKEIYEGDIVMDDCGYNGKYPKIVEFYEGRFIPLVKVEEGYNCIDSYYGENFEIIGNIYQNPELINK